MGGVNILASPAINQKFMKKLLYSAAALATLLFAASCQQENLEPARTGVTYTITLADEVQTKGKDGHDAYDLYYEVYRNTNAGLVELYDDVKEMTGPKTTVTLDLLNDQDYTVLFWANKKDTDYFEVSDLQNVTIKTASSNNEERDAFCGKDELTAHDNGSVKTVTLTRPFAQLNIATIVPETLDGYKITPESSLVKVTGAPKSFNVLTGEGHENSVGEVTYTVNTVPAVDIVVAPNTYKMAAMNYVFAPEGNITVYYEINTANGTVKNTINNVPVKKNYRTNIIGNLLTSDATYTVDIKPGFETEETMVEVWDGKTLNMPDYNAATETWTIDSGSELAWLANAVNGTLPSTKAAETAPVYKDGQTIVLGADINLGGREWTPIGVGDNRFEGTFDGKGYTISDFKISTRHGNKPQAALFGNLAGIIVLKDFTVEKANIVYPGKDDFYASAVVATAYGNVTLQNVTVKDSYISGNNKVAGLFAHDGVVSSLSIDNCHVLDSEIESLNEEDGGNVGGLVGLLQAKVEHSIKNSSVRNTVIKGINSSNTGKRANGEFVACVYGKNGLTVKIEDCEVENNTFTQNEGVTYVSPYGVFVGGYREDTGLPTVIVDGTEIYGVAKIGDTRYLTIDEAIANWTNNTTLTLLADVTLSDVVKIKSTEHHILNLGTYTMTAASGKNAFEIIASGTGDAERYAITINADATNPGGINAGKNAIVYYDFSKGTTSGNDRPIIMINGGVFNASTATLLWGTTVAGIHFKGGSLARQAATLNISGGEFNCSINGSVKSKMIISGGLFHHSVSSQGDQTAYRLISGGTFKTLGFMTADSNNTKFWFGTSMANSNVGVYVNDDNYLVVGGPVITEFDNRFQAKVKYSKWSNLLQYSSAATYGLYYTNASLLKETDNFERNPNL